MAQDAPEAVSSFPAPPGWFKQYSGDEGPPPPPPVKGKFQLFGRDFDVDEPLVAPLGAAQLFETLPDGSIDHKAELRRLNMQLLFVLVELLSVLVEQPDQSARLLTTINQLLQNMQFLVGSIRPAQALATLEHLLRNQVEQKQRAIAHVRERVVTARQLVVAAAGDLARAGGDVAQSAEQPPPAVPMGTRE